MVHHYLDYGGGLGDVVTMMVRQGMYEKLLNLDPDDTVEVHLTTGNPFARELFDYHPKASQITVFDHGNMPNGTREEKREWRKGLGLSPNRKNGRVTHPNAQVEFYPADLDKHLIEPYLGKRYVVLSASASRNWKTFPGWLVEKMARECSERGFIPIFVGRSYEPNIEYPEGFEVPVGPVRGEITPPVTATSFVDKLTVPTTAVLVQRACGVISCHSAIKLFALFAGRKLLLLYPDQMKEKVDSGQTVHKWVERHPLCVHTNYDDSDLQGKVDLFFGRLDAAAGDGR